MDWSYFDKFDGITDKYLPRSGEGETMASQIVTAVCKLVYKWYNDGDVYDNTGAMGGWGNDLSSYANWLYKNTPAAMLDKIWDCNSDEGYEQILVELADALLNEKYLEGMSEFRTNGSIYNCDGPFKFEPNEEWY